MRCNPGSIYLWCDNYSCVTCAYLVTTNVPTESHTEYTNGTTSRTKPLLAENKRSEARSAPMQLIMHNGDSGGEARNPWSVLCHNTTSVQRSTYILFLPACARFLGLSSKWKRMPPRRPPRLTDCQRKRQRPGNDPTVMKALLPLAQLVL